jgi:hypothetical protein
MLKKIKMRSGFYFRTKLKLKAKQYTDHFPAGPLIILLINLLLLNCFSGFGQSIIRSSISSLGSAVSEDGFILRQTIGQPSNTLIFITGELTLRQGFQQALSGENIYQAPDPLDFKLSPNPARDKTLIEFTREIKDYTITIYNLTGTPLAIIPGQELQSHWLDLKSYPEGMYIITITSDKKTGSKKLILNH